MNLNITRADFFLIQSALEETIEVLKRRIEQKDGFTHPADYYINLFDKLEKAKAIDNDFFL
jgi:Zn-dependent M32 family carboxypeptidase